MNIPFPPAFEERMRLMLQDDWEKFSSSHRADPPVSIRFNPAKNNPVLANGVPWTAFGMYLSQRPVFTLDPTLHGGAYYVQEASSMFLEQAIKQSLDLSQPLRVLDLCAAPGGKSTHLLSLLNRDSLLVANEVIRPRATILSENIQKWGHPNVLVTNNDAEDFQLLPGFFDLVVIDAPCSGEGLFRKDPEAMREWSPENVALCSQRQRRILNDVWPSIKENGILIYCTCTYNEQENEQNLIWLEKQKGLAFIDIKTEDSWGIQKMTKGNITGHRFYPHRVSGEGLFMAVVQKTENKAAVKIKTKPSFDTPARKTIDRLKEWILDSSAFQFILQGDLILMIPSRFQSDIEFMFEKLRVVTKGTAIATLKHEKLVPEHAFALSVELRSENFISVELDKQQAQSYLRKENLLLTEAKRGFALAKFEGLPLGWVNLLGNRVNNLYPSAWRIRMGS